MKKLAIIALAFCAINCQAQINTDRPTQSYSPFVLPKGKVQAELGFLSERPVSSVDLSNVTYVNALIRVGVVDRMELRITENYQGVNDEGSTSNGLSPTSLGAKFQLMEEENGFTQIGLITSLTLANGQRPFKANETVQDVRLLFQNSLGDKYSLAYNVGTVWSKSTDGTGVYTFNLGYSATDVVSLFVESYGFFTSGLPADHRMNGGAIFLLKDNLQADVSAGLGLSEVSPDYFLSFGVATFF